VSTRSLDPRWLAGVMTLGILCVGPEEEVRVDLEGRFELRQELIRLLAAGTPASAVAELIGLPEEAEQLLEGLERAGALQPGQAAPTPQPASIPLAEAVRRSARGEPFRLAT